MQEDKDDYVIAHRIWDRLLATELSKHAITWTDYLQWRRKTSGIFHFEAVLREHGRAMQVWPCHFPNQQPVENLGWCHNQLLLSWLACTKALL